ncbi:unnamed protein product [Lathyrus sativus]|nr:unnamed protein product [Lathyrus sativus]
MLNLISRKNIPITSTFSSLYFSSNSIKNTNTNTKNNTNIKNTNTNTILQILTNPKNNTNITKATSLTKQHLQNSNKPTNTCFSLPRAQFQPHHHSPLI